MSEEKGQEAPDAEAETEAKADAEAEAETEVKADAEEEVEAPGDEPPPAEPEDAFVAAPGILGRKVGMTQIFSADGNRLPVTIIEAGPCVVVQVKTRERDGYDALQLGFGDIRPKLVSMPRKGHFTAHGVEPTRLLRLRHRPSLRFSLQLRHRPSLQFQLRPRGPLDPSLRSQSFSL